MKKVIVSLVALAAANVTPIESADGPAAPAETKRVRWASVPPVKQNTYRVQRMPANPVINADWNKAAWKEIAPLVIEYYMGEEPDHQPKVQAKLAYDHDFIYVIWRVEDQYVLARRTRNEQDVWRDSCVEFFFTPNRDAEDRSFFNLETNCGGMKLFNAHVAGDKVETFTAADFASIVTASSLKTPIDPEIALPTTWTLEYKIPVTLAEKFAKTERPKPGAVWRANFYKCADESSHPHWLTWSPVTHAQPQFHLPEYFGILKFE